MAKVSIIIVNYNGKDLIASCLKALERQIFKNFEIILVDNGSSDDSMYEIQKFLRKSLITPIVKLVPLNINRGFTGGNTEGIKYAKGEYIALLNNDTEPDDRWLEELVKAMDANPNVGICASKMIVYGTDIIDTTGHIFSHFLKAFKRGEGEKCSLYNEQDFVFGACGGAVLYRAEMLDIIGFYDEDFFLIHEDVDMDFRAQLHGWKVLYVPTAIVHHKVRSSIIHMSDIAVYYSLRNAEFVRIKNIPLGIFLICLPQYMLGIITEFIYFALKHGKVTLYFKAKMDAIKMIPAMLKKRKLIMKNKSVTNRYLFSIMTPIWQKKFLKARIKKFLFG